LTGNSFTAAQGADWGLVNLVTAPGGALDGALALAQQITANGPLAVAATKAIIANAATWTPEEMWAKQMDIARPVFSSRDAREGAVAFAEKRAPNWTGS
jgi:enoyl-CoA hydratase